VWESARSYRSLSQFNIQFPRLILAVPAPGRLLFGCGTEGTSVTYCTFNALLFSSFMMSHPVTTQNTTAGYVSESYVRWFFRVTYGVFSGQALLDALAELKALAK
jgi:hypothetical protein